MRRIILSGRFRKDLKRMQKRGADLGKLDEVLRLLVADQPLPARCRPHRLSGEFDRFWECHIQPDWLLIYDISPETLDLAATGTHADLFR